MMNDWQGWLYVAAVLIPLAAFLVQLLFVRLLGRLNAYIATGAIVTSFVLSAVGFVSYYSATGGMPEPHHGAESHPEEGPAIAAGTGGAGLRPVALRVDDATTGAEGEASHGRPAKPLAWTGRWDWVSLGAGMGPDDSAGAPLVLPIGIHIDNLAVIMFVMVTFIASLIHIYSMGYMSGDPRYPRFFAYLSLFCFSMLGLVASANVFMVFVFWELVGVCSYLLIGFWYEDEKNADAANKAFIVNRVGDVGMLVGLGILWTQFGTFGIAALNDGLADPHLRDGLGRITQATAADGEGLVNIALPADGARDSGPAVATPKAIPYWLLVVAGLGIFAGCVGKSAQFPLQVWLPDAMAGPTPVSALIHAATMVAAGVYLVGRFFPLFTAEVLLTIAYTGGITLFIAATIAMVQTDYKKVLAYSTVSQLGFMMLGLGVGGWAAGLFHLLTHACFKALLFLGAGSVYHAVHTYEMPVLGGLFPKMRTTAITMLLATLAISGVPLFSGFYSKDAILAAAIHFATNEPQHLLLLILPVVGAALTAFYMFRMWFLLFTGTSRSHAAHGHDDHAHGQDDHGHAHGDPVAHAHESPPVMAWPLIALAVPTVMIGWPWLIFPFTGHPVLEGWLAYGQPLSVQDLGSAHLLAFAASLVIAATGIGVACLYYAPLEGFRRLDAADAARRFAPVHRFLAHKWYLDEIYDALLVRPTLGLARSIAEIDRVLIDGVVNGLAAAAVGLSRFEGVFDRVAVDGLVNLIARLTYDLGDWGRSLQTGRLRSYLMFLSAGVVVLFVGVFLWIRG